MVDVTNPAEIVGWGDYVFVARVESELRTEYTNLRQNEDGTITGKPYTVYSITVLENIKGELRKNEPIEFFKHGGVNYDGLSISLLEGDQNIYLNCCIRSRWATGAGNAELLY